MSLFPRNYNKTETEGKDFYCTNIMYHEGETQMNGQERKQSHRREAKWANRPWPRLAKREIYSESMFLRI